MTGAAPADETGRTPTDTPAGASEVAGEARGPVVYTIPSIARGAYAPPSNGGAGGGYIRSPLGVAGSSATGNLGEAHAAAWLLSQGYEVFFGLGKASCDLLALRDGHATRVEVKTSTTCRAFDGGRRRVYDTIAGLKDGQYDTLIWVIPTEGALIVNPSRPFYFAVEETLDV